MESNISIQYNIIFKRLKRECNLQNVWIFTASTDYIFYIPCLFNVFSPASRFLLLTMHIWSTCSQRCMCCIEPLLKIQAKWNSWTLSDAARKNSTPEEGTATWAEQTWRGRESAAGRGASSCMRELHKSGGEPAGKEIWRRQREDGNVCIRGINRQKN